MASAVRYRLMLAGLHRKSSFPPSQGVFSPLGSLRTLRVGSALYAPTQRRILPPVGSSANQLYRTGFTLPFYHPSLRQRRTSHVVLVNRYRGARYTPKRHATNKSGDDDHVWTLVADLKMVLEKMKDFAAKDVWTGLQDKLRMLADLEKMLKEAGKAKILAITTSLKAFVMLIPDDVKKNLFAWLIKEGFEKIVQVLGLNDFIEVELKQRMMSKEGGMFHVQTVTFHNDHPTFNFYDK